jgi:hypothetical protein
MTGGLRRNGNYQVDVARSGLLFRADEKVIEQLGAQFSKEKSDDR